MDPIIHSPTGQQRESPYFKFARRAHNDSQPCNAQRHTICPYRHSTHRECILCWVTLPREGSKQGEDTTPRSQAPRQPASQRTQEEGGSGRSLIGRPEGIDGTPYCAGCGLAYILLTTLSISTRQRVPKFPGSRWWWQRDMPGEKVPEEGREQDMRWRFCWRFFLCCRRAA